MDGPAMGTCGTFQQRRGYPMTTETPKEDREYLSIRIAELAGRISAEVIASRTDFTSGERLRRRSKLLVLASELLGLADVVYEGP